MMATAIVNGMWKGRQALALSLLLLSFGLEICVAFRLIEFELQPTTTSRFMCTENIARDIEMAAETCLINKCTEYITEISFSYSNCTAQNSISISGGVVVLSQGTTIYDPFITDSCVNNVLESDACKEFFVAVIPNLSSMAFTSQNLPETLVPTKAPTSSSPFSSPTGSKPTAIPSQPILPTDIPSLPSHVSISSEPTTAPSIQFSSKPFTPTFMIPTKRPEMLADITSAPTIVDKRKSDKNTVALGAVFALTVVTILLLGYLLVGALRKRQNGSKISKDRGPLDTTDTAFDNDEDPEIGHRQVLQGIQPLPNGLSDTLKLSQFHEEGNIMISPVESYINPMHKSESEQGNANIADNNDSLVLEDDELSSGSSTLFDVNGRNGYDDAESSVFYESQGEEDDEEDGTEIELDGTWGPDESSVASDGLKEGDDEEESIVGSTISSLGASGVENFGENPSPQQFMEWIKKSPLIPAAAKASIVAAAVAEVAAAEDRKLTLSPVTLPLNFNTAENSDASGRQSR